MPEYRTYRPRRPRASGGTLGRVVLVILIVGGLIFAGTLLFRGGGSSTSTNNSSEIDLVTDNANTNDASETNTNTVVASSSVTAWDNFSTDDCPAALSTVPTAKQVVLTVGLSAANDQVTSALDALKQANVPADVLVTGAFAEQHADVVRAAHDAGFAVYSQSYDSTDLTTLSDMAVTSAITKAETAITAATGVTPKPIFRPPAGSYTAKTVSLLQAAGYCTTLWTVDAFDWKSDLTVDQMQQRVIDAVKQSTRGSIVALHAGYDATPQLITNLVSALHAEGYTLATFATALQPTS